MADRIELHESAGWRWTMYAANNRIIGASTEGYAEKSSAIANAERVTGVTLRQVEGPDDVFEVVR